MIQASTHPIPDATQMGRTEPMSVEAAYRLASAGSLKEIRSAITLLGRARSIQRTVLVSATDLLGGNVPRGLHALQAEIDTAPPADRPYLVDLLAPLYVMSNRLEELDGLIESVPDGHPVGFGIAALRVVRDAHYGRRAGVLNGIDELMPYVDCGRDDLLVGKVAQRLALAAYYIKSYELATELAEKSVQAYGRVNASRLAVTSYSIIYNIHHAVTGDCVESLRAAQLMTEFAKAAGDSSYESIGLVAQYEIAAEMGDSVRLQDLRAQIRRQAVPEQFRERFACRIADFLPFAWEGHFEALRAGIAIAREATKATVAMRALATSLMALADCALGNEAESRSLARSAIGMAHLAISERETAYDSRYRLLARAIAGSTCALLGAADRGQRALESKAFKKHPDLAAFIDVAQGRDYRDLSIGNRGYARAIQATRDRLLKCKPNADLTRTEHAVLRLLAEGFTAAQIASEMNRSVFTIRNHTRAIIEKFDVSGRVAAVRHAHRLGLLD